MQPHRRFVVYAGTETFPLAHGVEAASLPAMMALVAGD